MVVSRPRPQCDTMATGARILGALLSEREGVDPAIVEQALGSARRGRERIGETLVRLEATSPLAVARALAVQLGIEAVEAPLEVGDDARASVDAELVHAHGVIPLSVTQRCIRLAMADPLDLTAMGDVQFQTGRRVEPVVTTPDAVEEALARFYQLDGAPADSTITAGAGAASAQGPEAHQLPDQVDLGAVGPVRERMALTELVQALPLELRATPETDGGAAAADLERATRDAPLVRLVDRIIRDAIDQGASDLHVEETGSDVRVRLRIDGLLRQTLDLPAAARRAVLSRIKVIGGMDIAVRRRAQDGRVSLTHRGRRLTLRVSTLPVNGGEKAVVRILDDAAAPPDLGALGMSDDDLAVLRGMLCRGEGVILAAGPTGSGKSTTLFAALSEVDRATQNVVTLEDPVEYRLPGASQVQVDRRAGLGFAEALRAVLRQDPDVVMIGEIRDRETAEIAMAAAVTGHLVLSTIHTTDATGAVTRLLHMGVPPFLVAGGLSGVVAQRLVRRSCSACRGRGCDQCDTGLNGRTGVYQVLSITDPMRDEISTGGSAQRLRKLASESGMDTLASDARRAVAVGLTTPHEVARFLKGDRVDARPCGACGSAVPFGAHGCPQCGRATRRRCACGQPMDRGWRYCAWCLRPTGG